jgi:hypothetical protein
MQQSGKLSRKLSNDLGLIAIWIGGPPGGFLRFEASKTPKQRFQLMQIHCVTGPEAEYVGEYWIKGETACDRVMASIAAMGRQGGFLHGKDRLGLTADAARTLVRDAAIKADVALMTEEQTRLMKRDRKHELIRSAVPHHYR